MSSMVRPAIFAIALSGALCMPVSAAAQDAAQWDNARANLVAEGPGPMSREISRWEQLYEDNARDSQRQPDPQLPFERYASFLVANPGFPDEMTLRARAEARLRKEFVPTEDLLEYFELYPPVTNFSKAHYALALMGSDRARSEALAREAWRGGDMSEVAEATIGTMFGNGFTAADHDARMDALLWQRQGDAAARLIGQTSPAARQIFQARLAILQGGDGATNAAGALTDPGYLYNRSRELRLEGSRSQAVSMLANRGQLAKLPFNPTLWVTELLNVARNGSARDAQAIAASIDDAFPPCDTS